MQKILRRFKPITALTILLIQVNTYAVYKQDFGIKVEAGSSMNNITLGQKLLDIDNDGPSPYKQTSYQDSFFGSFGAVFPLTKKAEVSLEILFSFNSKSKIKIAERVAEDATGPNYGKTDLSRNAGFVNLYLAPITLDIAPDFSFIPFIQAGIGLTNNYLSDTKIFDNTGKVGRIKSNGKFDLAWNIGAGFNLNMFTIGYRYIDYGDAETSNNYDVDGTNVNNAGLPAVIANKAITFDSTAHIVYVAVTV